MREAVDYYNLGDIIIMFEFVAAYVLRRPDEVEAFICSYASVKPQQLMSSQLNCSPLIILFLVPQLRQ
jgi:hypothetical protein